METLAKTIVWIVVFGALWSIIKYTKRIDVEFKELSPKSKPYIWGYFFGILYFMIGIFILCFAIFSFLNNKIDYVIFIWLIPVFFNTVLGIKVINRGDKAFTIATVLTLNPIIWVINYFYMKNRYDDFH